MPRRNRRTSAPAASQRPLTIPDRKRRLLEMTEHRCYYCGGGLTEETMTIDHVIPVSKGGPTSMSNLVACCKRCNRIKANNSVEKFRTFGRFRKRGFYGDSIERERAGTG